MADSWIGIDANGNLKTSSNYSDFCNDTIIYEQNTKKYSGPNLGSRKSWVDAVRDSTYSSRISSTVDMCMKARSFQFDKGHCDFLKLMHDAANPTNRELIQHRIVAKLSTLPENKQNAALTQLHNSGFKSTDEFSIFIKWKLQRHDQIVARARMQKNLNETTQQLNQTAQQLNQTQNELAKLKLQDLPVDKRKAELERLRKLGVIEFNDEQKKYKVWSSDDNCLTIYDQEGNKQSHWDKGSQTITFYEDEKPIRIRALKIEGNNWNCGDLISDFKQLEKDKTAAEGQVANLTGEKGKLEGQVAKLQEANEGLDGQVKTLTDQSNALMEQNGVFKQNLQRLEETNKGLVSENGRLATNLTTLEQNTEQAGCTVDANNGYTVVNTKADDLENQLNTAQVAAATFGQQLADSQEENAELKKENEVLQAKDTFTNLDFDNLSAATQTIQTADNTLLKKYGIKKLDTITDEPIYSIKVDDTKYQFDNDHNLTHITTKDGTTYCYKNGKITGIYTGPKDNRKHTPMPPKSSFTTPAQADEYIRQQLEKQNQELEKENQKLEEDRDSVYVPLIQKDEKGKEKTVFVKLRESKIKEVAGETDETKLTREEQLKDTVIIEIGGKSYVVTKAEFEELTKNLETVEAKAVRNDMDKNHIRLAKQTQSTILQEDCCGRCWYGSYSVGGSELVKELGVRQKVVSGGWRGRRQYVVNETYETANETAKKERSRESMASRLRRLNSDKGGK